MIKDPLFTDNFVSKGKYFMVRCPNCKRENYAMNVASGVCTWCGTDGNLYGDLLEIIKGDNDKKSKKKKSSKD